MERIRWYDDIKEFLKYLLYQLSLVRKIACMGVPVFCPKFFIKISKEYKKENLRRFGEPNSTRMTATVATCWDQPFGSSPHILAYRLCNPISTRNAHLVHYIRRGMIWRTKLLHCRSKEIRMGDSIQTEKTNFEKNSLNQNFRIISLKSYIGLWWRRIITWTNRQKSWKNYTVAIYITKNLPLYFFRHFFFFRLKMEVVQEWKFGPVEIPSVGITPMSPHSPYHVFSDACHISQNTKY